MSHSGMFSQNLFSGVSLGAAADTRMVDQSLQPIANLDRYSSTHAMKWSRSYLEQKGIAYFTVSGDSTDGPLTFRFFDLDQEQSNVIPAMTSYPRGSGPVPPAPGGKTTPVFQEGDGLLPASTTASDSGPPRWLPWALLGGGLLVAGGIVWASSRRPVRANKRRRRHRRRR
jgi:hypothetical protein